MGPGRRGDHLTTYQPTGIAFDASGSLWVANGDYTVVEFGANQVGASGAPAPIVSLLWPGFPVGLAFDPPPANLPLSRAPWDY